MQITVIGTGYVGLVAGACLADMGNDVICIDNNLEKLKQLENGIIPIYEPGLEELVKSNVLEHRLEFSSDIDSAVKKSQVCFIAVGTPQGEDGSADLKYVFEVAKSIAKAMNGYKVIVDKSTVPVGTAQKVEEIIKQYTNYEFDVVSNPEFLKQGNAVDDFLHPDRVVIGSNSDKATAIMQEIYSPFFRTGNRVIVMDVKSAEMTKYAANSFLATKISFMNEIANLCEKVGADAEMVRVGMSTDSRIGNKFLFPGLGYGGSCFPKDVKALINTGLENDCEMNIIKAADETNKKQRNLFIEKIKKHFNNNLKDKTIAIWGLAFKPKTNDMREAPAITIIQALLENGAKIKAFDPKAFDSAKFIFDDKIEYSKSSYEAVQEADCLLLLTEWNEFRRPDFDKLKGLLKNPTIFDGRNQYDPKRMKEKGFDYICIGKKSS
ncbi:MAG: UDP-glucose/GDP-mannose dehydrogenase family protein [Candidatus Gastranaerophilales bacterium]|nr:UDP-glucose/GDP-mannose dehydrogenase family protein [Candidatus Gastranaerophilales bacterium]